MVSLSLTSSSAIVTIFCILLLLLLQPYSMHGAKTNKTGPLVPALLVFGDSIVDTGNNNNIFTAIRCDFPPYGQDFVNQKATGRFCNGEVPSDILASYLGLKETVPAYVTAGKQDLLTGVSFASGGTGYDHLTSDLALVISMTKQVEMFQEYKTRLISMVGDKKAATIISGSLFLVCAGSNDVVNYFKTPFRKTYTIPAYAEYLTKAASNFTQALINLGAKKIGFLGIPPVGCLPSQRSMETRDCTPMHNQLSQLFNSRISRELQRLMSSHDRTKLIYIDIYSSLLDLIQHPKIYAFEESTKGCCGNGDVVGILCNTFSTTCANASSYVFWDSFHPTERAYRVIVKQAAEKYLRFLIEKEN